MPEIARFYGLVIKMFFMKSEHNPPHFHAIYGEYMGEFDINTLEMLQGDLPTRAINIVREWAELHQSELLEMRNTQKIHKLDGLFEQVRVDAGGLGIVWNDELDLDADEIYYNGY